MKKINDLLDELEGLIEGGNTIPFSTRSLILPDDALEIIDEIRQELPSEIEEAKKIVSEKNKILVEAQNDADLIRQEADKKVREMINESEISRIASEQAEEILENAQKSARELRIGTIDYTDNLLFDVQKQLQKLNETLDNNRKELNLIKQD